MDPAKRLSAVFSTGDDGKTSFGTAFWLGGDTYLTADHAVAQDSVLVRVGADWRDGKVVAREARPIDVAVVRLRGGPTTTTVSNTRAWMKRPKADLEAVALGYPEFHRAESAPDTLCTERFRGELDPITAHDLNQLHVKNKRPPPSDSPSDWAGMSGAGVVGANALLGIVTDARRDRLIATPISALIDSPLWPHIEPHISDRWGDAVGDASELVELLGRLHMGRLRDALAEDLKLPDLAANEPAEMARSLIESLLELDIADMMKTIYRVNEAFVRRKTGDLAEDILELACRLLPHRPELLDLGEAVLEASDDVPCVRIPATQKAVAEIVRARLRGYRADFELDGRVPKGRSAMVLPLGVGIDADSALAAKEIETFAQGRMLERLTMEEASDSDDTWSLMAETFRLDADAQAMNAEGSLYFVVTLAKGEPKVRRATLLAERLRRRGLDIDVVVLQGPANVKLETAVTFYVTKLLERAQAHSTSA